MGRVVLIRHAQASFGAADYDRLSPLGHQQADWLAGYFRAHDLMFDRVIRGDLRRHRETAAALATHGIGPEPAIDPRLDEFDYDPLQDAYHRATGIGPAATRAEFLAVFPEVLTGWAEGRLTGARESFADFETRVADAVDEFTAQDRTTLIVTSGGVIGMVLRRILRLDIRATADVMLSIHNASVHELTPEAGSLRLSLFNAIPHFDPTERSHARTYI